MTLIDEEIIETPRDTFDDVYEPSEEELAAWIEEQERQNQIGAAKVILAQTDHEILKACEDLLLQSSAISSGSFKAGTVSTSATTKPSSNALAEVIALRREQRELISELEE